MGLTPHFDRLVYVIYNNEDAEASALRNGEIDFGQFDSANILNSLAGAPNVAARGAQVPRFDDLGFNTGSAFQSASDGFEPHGDGAHAFTDPVVRRAIRQAVDNQTIVDKVLLGYATPADSPVQPTATTGDWDPSPEQALPFDVSAANAALDAAGYRRDTDGVRIDPTNGPRLEFRYFTRNADQNTIETAPFIKDWLARIGIAVDVSDVSSAKMASLVFDGTYDLVDSDWFPSPDPNYILGVFPCVQRPPRPGVYGNNDSYYCDPRYDELMRAQARAIDPARRAHIVHQMQAMLYEDSPYVVMYYGQTLEAYRTDRVTGFIPQPPDTATSNGDLLATFGPFSFMSMRLATGASGGPVTKGASAGVWLTIALGAAAVIVIVLLARRRRRSDEEHD